MAAGIVVKAVTGGLEAFGLCRDLRGLWASENQNRKNDLSATQLDHFDNHFTPMCKRIATDMGCRSTQIALDARILTDGDARWGACPRGIDFFIGKPLVVVNREMLPNAPEIPLPIDAKHQDYQACLFGIAKAVATLKLNSQLKCTILRIIVFVGTVFFLSPVLPTGAYAIALIVERFISLRAHTYYNKWALQLAIKRTPREVQDGALARLDSMKKKAASKVDGCHGLALAMAKVEKILWEKAYDDLDTLIRADRNPQT